MMSRKIKSSAHGADLVSGVAGLLSDQHHKYSDVTVKAGYRSFHCHKLILALQSPYFEQKLFPTAATASVGSDQIVLNDIRAEDFDSVLHFMYMGQITLREQNLENILRAADILLLPKLKQFCVDYMLDTLSADNCLRYWKQADQMNLAALSAACARLAAVNFVQFSHSTDVGNLSQKMMKGLLAEDALACRSEVAVCEVLLKWLDKPAGRMGTPVELHQLLTCIRWSAVPVDYAKRLLQNGALVANRQCFEFLSKVVAYHVTGVQFEGVRTFHRPSTRVEQSVVIVGVDVGENMSSDVYRVHLQRSDDMASRLEAVPTRMEADAVACAYGKEVYVTGVGDTMKETWKLDSLTRWTKCADMCVPRSRHNFVLVDSTSLYVLGGFNIGRTLVDVEEYSTVTNKWRRVGELILAVKSAAAVVHKTSVYVFGGSSHNNPIMDYVQVFDTATKLCTVLTEPLPRPQSLLRAVMWDKSVLLMNYGTCLLFHLENGMFEQRNQFAAGVFNFGLAIEDQRVFVIGGGQANAGAAGRTAWALSDEVKSVPVMDIVNNEPTAIWTRHAKLPTPCCVHAHAVMTLPV